MLSDAAALRTMPSMLSTSDGDPKFPRSDAAGAHIGIGRRDTGARCRRKIADRLGLSEEEREAMLRSEVFCCKPVSKSNLNGEEGHTEFIPVYTFSPVRSLNPGSGYTIDF